MSEEEKLKQRLLKLLISVRRVVDDAIDGINTKGRRDRDVAANEVPANAIELFQPDRDKPNEWVAHVPFKEEK